MSAKRIENDVTPRMFINATENAGTEKMECGARELEGIRLSLAYYGMLDDSFDAMKERLETFPRGVWRWKTAMTHLLKLNRMLMNSIPGKTWHRLDREKGTHAWQYQPMNVDRKVCQVVYNEDIKVVIDQVISDNCAMCLKERSEWRACPLRKAMIQITPPGEIDRKSAECPYQIVARNCDYGDYMSTEHRILGNGDDDRTKTMRG